MNARQELIDYFFDQGGSTQRAKELADAIEADALARLRDLVEMRCAFHDSPVAGCAGCDAAEGLDRHV